MYEDGDYYVYVSWACGMISVKDGNIIGGAPIFRKWTGTKFLQFVKKHNPELRQLKEGEKR